jgi:predicted lipoprotein with Yx(FWY)xxD motif
MVAGGADVRALAVDHVLFRRKEHGMTRTRRISYVAGAAAVLLAVLVVAGCGGSGSSASPTLPKTSDGQAATLGISNGNLGKVLVDSQGRTLYLFEKDTGTTSTCTGECAVNWPPLLANGTPTLGSGASASLIGTSMRADGKSQVTYNGHPLYRFQNDTKAGDTNGEGLNAFGGSWFAVSAAGNKVSGPSSSGGGGYGY